MSVLAPRDPATPDRPAPFRRWGQALLDLFVPPRCLACGAVVHATEGVCPRCWPGLAFITDPVCAACGLPLEFELGTGALCGACLKDRPVFDSARAIQRPKTGAASVRSPYLNRISRSRPSSL
ncbi:MAG: double zinc ribbon domain-containing protein [Alphaproteobacteria bacterium]